MGHAFLSYSTSNPSRLAPSQKLGLHNNEVGTTTSKPPPCRGASRFANQEPPNSMNEKQEMTNNNETDYSSVLVVIAGKKHQGKGGKKHHEQDPECREQSIYRVQLLVQLNVRGNKEQDTHTTRTRPWLSPAAVGTLTYQTLGIRRCRPWNGRRSTGMLVK